MNELVPKGYKVPYDPTVLGELKRDLLVRPETLSDYGQPQPFPVYRKNKTHIFIPKFYGISKYGVPPRIRENTGTNIDTKFQGKLRDYQTKICKKILNHIKTNDSCVLSLYCGAGKTICALYIASLIGKKTIIFVHKEFLLKQWIERISEFLPNARIGVIQQNTYEIENKDIVIAMIQTVVSRKYSVQEFGFTLIDECHRICSRTFSRTLFHITSKYSLGLSATPTRKDGLTKILNWFLGDILTFKSTTEIPLPQVETIIAQYANTPVPKYNALGKINRPNLVNQIANDPTRNKQIFDWILAHNNRKILLLSERRSQCFHLVGLLQKHGLDPGIYVGGMKDQELKEANTKNIILATYSMCSEGYDNKHIDTLIMATGRSDIEQSVGRIQRQINTNKPLILDIKDTHMEGQFGRRIRWYRKKGFKILAQQTTN